jgi:hypothetical protein
MTVRPDNGTVAEIAEWYLRSLGAVWLAEAGQLLPGWKWYRFMSNEAAQMVMSRFDAGETQDDRRLLV